ncbi:hypothetical protein Ancab_011328 [Ancistrocladus abbreviatus]
MASIKQPCSEHIQLSKLHTRQLTAHNWIYRALFLGTEKALLQVSSTATLSSLMPPVDAPLFFTVCSNKCTSGINISILVTSLLACTNIKTICETAEVDSCENIS